MNLPPAQLIERVLDHTGYLDWVEQQDNLEHTSRADNLRELSNAMAEATEQGQTLEDMLDHAALVSDADEYDETVSVSLMTLHSAKGLEFDAVFLAGLEEGLLPHSRSLNSNARTRRRAAAFLRGHDARQAIARLSRAIYRRTYGEERLRASLPSRFIAEIPGDLIEAAAGSYSEPGQTRRYEPDPEFSEGYGYAAAMAIVRLPAAPGALDSHPGASALFEQSADRRARPPFQIRRGHDHRNRRRWRRPQAHRQLSGLRREETGRTLRQPAVRLNDSAQIQPTDSAGKIQPTVALNRLTR